MKEIHAGSALFVGALQKAVLAQALILSVH